MIETFSLWDKLKNTALPIFMYGTGNGADKIINALYARGIKLEGIFASDGYVRDRYFRDIKVKAYSDIISEYGNDIIVLLAFGSTLESVIEFIRELDRKHELIIPEVPLYGGDIFDMEYYISHKEQLDKVREIFCDERSKQIFDDAINFRLTGKLSYLSNVSTHIETLEELYGNDKIKLLLDAGAFKGDSTRDFAATLDVDRIIAVEADPRTYLKLKTYADSERDSEVVAVNAAIWDKDTTLEYISSASRGSGESGRNKRAKETVVDALTIDTILSDNMVDFIKLDIEGAESNAILGAEKALYRDKPNMEVSLYHRTEDLFELPLRLHEILPTHKFYLRRVPCIPMWDLNLFIHK